MMNRLIWIEPGLITSWFPITINFPYTRNDTLKELRLTIVKMKLLEMEFDKCQFWSWTDIFFKRIINDKINKVTDDFHQSINLIVKLVL